MRNSCLSEKRRIWQVTMQAKKGISVGLLSVLAVLGFPIDGCELNDARADTGGEVVASVQSLVEHEDEYLGKVIRVTGKLENIGKNYFTDLRVVLRDCRYDNTMVYVRPWLPLELPPAAPGAPQKRPVTLTEFLGKSSGTDSGAPRGRAKKCWPNPVPRSPICTRA